MTSTTLRAAAPEQVRARWRSSGPWYVGGVAVGSVLIVWAALNQPFNQNELQQIQPYGSDSLARITGGTRQPPMGPLLGAAFQHLLGEGQLQQRLVPVLAGIGSLVAVALLFRRLRLGAAGAVAMWVMATAPLMLRYSAYTRPYMLPMFLMLVFVYAAHRFIEDRRTRWLALATGAAMALPLARVPEPIVFLVTVAVVLTLLGTFRKLPWSRVWPLLGVVLSALILVGYPMYKALATRASGVYDPSLSGIISRFDRGVEELATFLFPLLGDWLPWWPVTVLVVIAALAVPTARRRLLGWWFLWPLLAAPVAFVLAYHFMNPYSFDVRPYRPRMATFFVPAYILVVAALASAVTGLRPVARWARGALVALLGAALIGQLPATARVLVENEAADYGQAAEVLTEELPDDAIVFYDVPSPIGMWRQPFSAKPRYMGNTPYVATLSHLSKRAQRIPTEGPVYVLLLDSECSYSVVCNVPEQQWDDKNVRGWHVQKRFDKFTLYAPDEPQSGRQGAINAMKAFAEAMGPRLGYPETFVAAALLKLEGRPEEGKAVIREMYADASDHVAGEIRQKAERKNLDPFRR